MFIVYYSHLSYKQISSTEAQGGVMRLIVGGGRAAESSESKGAVVVGVRTLSEGGRVGNFSREQVLTLYFSNFNRMKTILNCTFHMARTIILILHPSFKMGRYNFTTMLS